MLSSPPATHGALDGLRTFSASNVGWPACFTRFVTCFRLDQ